MSEPAGKGQIVVSNFWFKIAAGCASALTVAFFYWASVVDTGTKEITGIMRELQADMREVRVEIRTVVARLDRHERVPAHGNVREQLTRLNVTMEELSKRFDTMSRQNQSNQRNF